MDHAPWEPQLASSGLERHTLKCRDCGDLELRLVFGHYRVDAGATQDDLAGPFCGSPTDVGQQQDTALPADPIFVSLADSSRQKDAATPTGPLFASPTDMGQQEDTAHPADPISVSPADSSRQKDAALPAGALSASPTDISQHEDPALPAEPISDFASRPSPAKGCRAQGYANLCFANRL